MKFTKMHSLGNDYVYVDLFSDKIDNPSLWATFLSHRRYGIGSDGLVLIGDSNVADFSMRVFNVDGTEAQMCGNALRSVGKYIYIKKYTQKKDFTIETLSGIKKIYITDDKNGFKIKADIGAPILEPEKIPCTRRLIDEPYMVRNREFLLNSVSMGNPHCVTYIDDIESFDIDKYGFELENNTFYPKRTNVEFVKVIDKNTLQMRTWERGCSETWACGTGCSAAVVISVLHGLTERNVNVIQLGGTLHLEWSEVSGCILLESDAEIVFSGEVEESALNNFERTYKDETERFYKCN